MNIITTPNPSLLARASEVVAFDKKLRDMLLDMERTLLATTDPKGVGLAAPQVSIAKRIFLAKPSEKSKTQIFINPVIESVSDEREIPDHTNSPSIERNKPKKKKLFEGCLSIPNFWGNVTRHKELTLTWQDEHGKSHTKHFKGFMATIIQHEIDHLNGILFTKHVMEQHEKLYKSHKNEKGEDEFDEVKI